MKIQHIIFDLAIVFSVATSIALGQQISSETNFAYRMPRDIFNKSSRKLNRKATTTAHHFMINGNSNPVGFTVGSVTLKPSIGNRHETDTNSYAGNIRVESPRQSSNEIEANILNKEEEILREPIEYSVTYKLYNYKCTEGTTIRIGEKISAENWVAGRNTVFIIHGWLMFRFEHTMIFKDAYSGRPENVIIVYWESAANQLNYIAAAKDIYLVGVSVAHMVIYLKTQKLLDYSQVKLVGFSLGAHIAGVVGFFINDKLQTQIREITGLDPAGPMFKQDVHLRYRLDKSDAKFVQVIHCNMGKLLGPFLSLHYGTDLTIGHVDFYPNGGIDQPNCLRLPHISSTCSHMRCCELYASTVRGYSFKGCACDNVNKFFTDICHPHNTCTCDGPSMGDLCPANATGKYCLNAMPDSRDKLNYLYTLTMT